MRDPSGREVNFDSYFNPDEPESEELPEQEEVDALEECLASGLHNTRTDDDGYCERCGFQFIIREAKEKQ